MKHVTVLSGVLFSFFCIGSVRAQTTLVAGDIAFTGYNADDNTINGPTANDDFSFILLRNIAAGTVIYFTDFGWRSDVNVFQSVNSCGASTGALSDGVVQWTATSAMTYGTQVYIRCRVTPSANVGTATGYQATFNFPSEYMSLAIGGDQVIAFQGSLATPTLIAGMNMNGAWDASIVCTTFSASSSVQPPALSTNNYSFAIVPEVDNARLKSTVVLTGSAASDRAAIHNAANWDVNDATAFALPAPGVGLPVTFVSFSVQKSDGMVRLTWKVADEYQLESYRIERSANGMSWEEAGSIQATGSTVYHWTDQQTITGRMHYRIRSVDLDGSYQYSPVITLTAERSGWALQVLPNPVTTNATIQLAVPHAQQLELRIVRADGTLVWRQQERYMRGTHILHLQTRYDLPAGTYFLLLQAPETGFRQHIRFVKL